jgi:hypothetical protein
LVYLLVGITDFSISATGFPVAVSYFKNRDPCLFADHVFCSLWGFLWEIIPYMSVYLMVVIAVSRASTLNSPLMVLNIRVMCWSSILYLLLCCTSKIIPQLLMYDPGTSYAYATFHFNRDSLYCFLYPAGRYWVINSVQSSLQLGLPAPAILSSCAICVVVLQKLGRRCKKLCYSRGVGGRKPTTTILLLSAVYMASNLPVFLNYLLYSFTWLAGNKYTRMYHNTFLYWYSWNLTYVVSVCFNSAINPVVLFLRMSGFRNWTKNKFRTRRRD